MKEQFCCPGCEMVYRTIHDCGLTDYYRLRAATTDTRVRPETRTDPFAEFDDPAFHQIYVRQDAEHNATIELLLEGVHCAACVWLVEKLPSVVPGVIEARLNLRRRMVTIRWNADETLLSTIANTLNALGYRPHPARGVNARKTQVLEERRMLVRIAIAGFCTGNVMVLSFALYGGAAEGDTAQFGHLFRILAMMFALVSIIGPGSLFFRGAIASLRARAPHLDLPIALALTAGGVWGVVNTIRGQGEVYFDSLTALVFLLLIGRYIQQRQQRAAADSVELLHAFTPSVAHLLCDGATRDVPVDALRPGDVVRIGPGEVVPADATVLDGASTLDVAILTGESAPVSVAAGDELAAGTLNLTSPLSAKITTTGTQTRIGQLMSLIADAAERRAPLLTLTNRIAGVFTVVVIILALGSFLANLNLGLEVASERTIALLIVCCPCALGLATPLAVTSAIGRAARRGMMIKGSEALEHLTHAGVMFLDKTGTVTEGRFAVAELVGDADALAQAAAIEREINHPIASALVAACPDAPRAEGVRLIDGIGVTGTVKNREVFVGSLDAISDLGFAMAEPFARAAARGAQSGRTPVAIASNKRVTAVALLEDQPRPDAKSVLSQLKHQGWSVRIISGDNQAVTTTIASAVGVNKSDAFGAITPEGKLKLIEQTPGLTVMVGDGVNDAAALAAADVGIAVRGGAEASLEAADIALTKPGLTPILDVLRVARSTRRTIIACLSISLVYNTAAATAAFTGFVGPITAAILMPLSSAIVMATASRAASHLRSGSDQA